MYYRNQRGFSLIELMVVMVLISVIGGSVYTFTVASGNNYLKLHADGIRFSELSDKSQRMTRVLRGAGDITEANNDSLTTYAYFSPADQYYSLVHYYLSADKKQLMADVTKMTSNPPTGTPINGSLQTFTVMTNFYDDPAVATFQYLDSAGTAYPLPITDLHTIKGIRVNMASADPKYVAQTKASMSVQVTLRNRKTNL